MYSRLDPDSIIKTAKKLKKRVDERFEGRGIADVCAELVAQTEKAKDESEHLNNPYWPLRLLVGAVVAAGAIVFIYIGTFLNFSKVTTETFSFVQGLEASINTLILAGLGLAFLFNVERRQKRKRALAALHQLRSLTHVIDMHQLTKDPSVILKDGPATESSPKRDLNEFELTRYLDYCSEMLSICGKAAALYAQHFNDSVTVSAVNDIELLTTNLSRKIWQKIVLIHRGGDGGTPPSKIKAALLDVAGR